MLAAAATAAAEGWLPAAPAVPLVGVDWLAAAAAAAVTADGSELRGSETFGATTCCEPPTTGWPGPKLTEV